MAGPKGMIGRIEAHRDEVLETSLTQLGSDTAAVVSRHEARLADASKNAVAQYFDGKAGETLDAEELALLHYAQSGGEDLPSNEELAPRVEAAERVMGVIAETDMLLALIESGSINLTRLKKDDERQPKLANSRNHPTIDSAYIFLPRVGNVPTFSLIGEEDLATPIDSVEGVDTFFRKQKEDLLAGRSFSYGPYLPLIAGSTAISRFAVDLGTMVTIRDQETDPDEAPEDASFVGFFQRLVEFDPDLAGPVIEEVRTRKPKLIEAARKALSGDDLDEDLQTLIDNVMDEEEIYEGPIDVYSGDVTAWLENSTVELFYTPEELQQVKSKLKGTLQAALEKRAKQKAAELKIQTASTLAGFAEDLEA
jgi:hypothetical protein